MSVEAPTPDEAAAVALCDRLRAWCAQVDGGFSSEEMRDSALLVALARVAAERLTDLGSSPETFARGVSVFCGEVMRTSSGLWNAQDSQS
jgi:hypothetical protein